MDDGQVNPAEIVAMIGKTEGNGGANDFTRGFATLSYSMALAKRLGVSPEEVVKRVAFVWSGGTEGVLSPHATLFTRSASERVVGKRLAFGLGVTRDFAPEEVGTLTEVREVAAAVGRAQDEAGILDRKDVHYVQVKGPLLTPAAVADADRRGVKLVTRDPNGSKAFARGATALGVALALGELSEADLNDAVIAQRMDLFSSVANTSAGGELKNCEILLFGNSEAAGGDLRIGTPFFPTSSTQTLCAPQRVTQSGIPRQPSTQSESLQFSPRPRRRQTACCGAPHHDAVRRRY
jgi:cyanuric acid amidohydrolase